MDILQPRIKLYLDENKEWSLLTEFFENEYIITQKEYVKLIDLFEKETNETITVKI